MCLTFTGFKTREEARKFYNNPKIAKKDINVYKALKPLSSHQGKSPHKSFYYDQGTHYYNVGRKFSAKILKPWHTWVVDIHQGLHACTHLERVKIHSQHYVRMIIPKGSKYYVNHIAKEIVADNLIWPHTRKIRSI